jgi:glucosylceramidase
MRHLHLVWVREMSWKPCFSVFLFFATLFVCPSSPSHAQKYTARVWISSENINGQPGKQIEPQPDIPLLPPNGASVPAISIKPEYRRQSILGIGSSMEETSVWNLLRMSPAVRQGIMEKLFDQSEGIGWNALRIVFGSPGCCGYPYYTYCDLPPGSTDPALSNFSIQKDIDYGIIDMLQQALSINPDLLIFATSFTPPAWMKDNGSLIGGKLLDRYIPVMATYLCMAVQAYRQQGITIYAVSPQNEPGHETNYPSANVTSSQAVSLVKALRAELDNHGLAVKIWIFDGFYSCYNYPLKMLNDPTCRSYINGVAWHPYEGTPSEMAKVLDRYPLLDQLMTERGLIYGASAVAEMLAIFQNGARFYANWVTASDTDNEHLNNPAAQTQNWHWMPVRPDADDPDQVTIQESYYLEGLVSKFVRPGAYLLAGDAGNPATVTAAAFLTPDKNIVAIVVNQTTRTQQFKLLCRGWQINASLPRKSVGAYRWPAEAARTGSP